MLLETRQLFELALENVHICLLETRQLLLIQIGNDIRRLIYVFSSDL